MSTSLLMIEDDLRLAQMVGEYLGQSGMQLAHCPDAASGLARLQGQDGGTLPELVILDLMLPDMDGLEVCRRIRALPGPVAQMPVLMLTAKGDPMDRVIGLEIGADDYLPKPFNLGILIARIGGLLRRKRWLRAEEAAAIPQPAALDEYSFDGRTIDFTQLQLRHGREIHQLTLMESELLRYLIKNAGRNVSRKAILEDVWNLHEDTDTRAIDNFVVRLRRYIEDDPARPQHLLTVRGVGYRFMGESQGK